MVEFKEEELVISEDALKYATDDEIKQLKQICRQIIKRRKVKEEVARWMIR